MPWDITERESEGFVSSKHAFYLRSSSYSVFLFRVIQVIPSPCSASSYPSAPLGRVAHDIKATSNIRDLAGLPQPIALRRMTWPTSKLSSNFTSVIANKAVALQQLLTRPTRANNRPLTTNWASDSRPFTTTTTVKMPLHHLMIGTWTPPGAIFTVAFDDEKLTLELIKKTEIPQDEPISWMTFDVSRGWQNKGIMRLRQPSQANSHAF